jgi:hypothetical protein
MIIPFNDRLKGPCHVTTKPLIDCCFVIDRIRYPIEESATQLQIFGSILDNTNQQQQQQIIIIIIQ